MSCLCWLYRGKQTIVKAMKSVNCQHYFRHLSGHLMSIYINQAPPWSVYSALNSISTSFLSFSLSSWWLILGLYCQSPSNLFMRTECIIMVIIKTFIPVPILGLTCPSSHKTACLLSFQLGFVTKRMMTHFFPSFMRGDCVWLWRILKKILLRHFLSLRAN